MKNYKIQLLVNGIKKNEVVNKLHPFTLKTLSYDKKIRETPFNDLVIPIKNLIELTLQDFSAVSSLKLFWTYGEDSSAWCHKKSFNFYVDKINFNKLESY